MLTYQLTNALGLSLMNKTIRSKQFFNKFRTYFKPIKYAPLFGTLLLTNCATSYQSSTWSITGGYDDKPVLDTHLTKVKFSGNGFTSGELAQSHNFYRCAEYCKDRNKPYFKLFKNLTDAARNKNSDNGQLFYVFGKPTVISFVLPLEHYEEGSHKVESILANRK